MARLGRVQQAVLKALERHKFWHEDCGWVWDSVGGTKRVLESLVNRGIVYTTGERTIHGSTLVYRPTGSPTGRQDAISTLAAEVDRCGGQRAFSRLSGLHVARVNKILQGKRVPSLREACVIETYAGVAPRQWLGM